MSGKVELPARLACWARCCSGSHWFVVALRSPPRRCYPFGASHCLKAAPGSRAGAGWKPNRIEGETCVARSESDVPPGEPSPFSEAGKELPGTKAAAGFLFTAGKPSQDQAACQSRRPKEARGETACGENLL